MSTREERLAAMKMVADCIMQDRNVDYGDPEDNFRDIGAIEDMLMGAPEDIVVRVARRNLIQKLARTKQSPHKLDHYIDIAGYALCAAARIIKMEKERDAALSQPGIGQPLPAYPNPNPNSGGIGIAMGLQPDGQNGLGADL